MFHIMDVVLIIVAIVALTLGGLIGWLFAGRQSGALAAERDSYSERFRAAITDLAQAEEGRESAEKQLAGLMAEREARDAAHVQQLSLLQQARDGFAVQFQDVSAKLLERMQGQFMENASARFKASEAESASKLVALLQPVDDRLKQYEESVRRVETERREAYGNLQGLMDSLRISNEGVKAEAARLGNALRNAPKARGRWGEQQLRNVLESCGLSEYADFQTEVNVAGDDGGRLRPDVIIRVPGGQHLVVDAKVSLNAYQDAFEAEDEAGRAAGLAAHATSVKTHINALGNKAYWSQFETAPDYVILFIPGEHFLSAALEQDHGLWDFAFDKRVLLATPTNLIAIARTVAAVWRQERLADDAREIAALGKELYARLATMGAHVARLGKNLNIAVDAYNGFVGSLDTQVMTSAARFEKLGVDTGAKVIEPLPIVDAMPRQSIKLVASSDQSDGVPNDAMDDPDRGALTQ
jgi:DNA recombination protein RmuC